MTDPAALLTPFLSRWELVPDGAPIVTFAARLLPVRFQGQPAMLKVAVEPEEIRGGRLLAWWDGGGAARVLAQARDALLLERSDDPGALIRLATGGPEGDDAACRVLCGVAARLHAARPTPPPEVVPLERWFAALGPAAARRGGLLRAAYETAQTLFADPREVSVLHGDLHHGNVLPFGAGEWRAIDPKGLIGERGYDFANIFPNPDPALVGGFALEPGRLARRADVVARETRLERRRLLQWVLAYCGLSVAWMLEGGLTPGEAGHTLTVGEMAAAELGR